MSKVYVLGLLLIVVLTLGGCQGSDSGSSETPTKGTVSEETTALVEEATESVVGEEVDQPTWRSFAEARGIRVGAAIMAEYLQEEDYAATLATHYNTITPENQMKWSFIHPGKETYDFVAGDTIVSFAQANDMDVRGHALVWHIQNPEWLINEEWTDQELEAILEDHIKTVVTHYKGQVYAWDVVNEMFENGLFRETIWYEAMGSDYIEKALRWTHEADPDTLLYLNDYGVEEMNIKSNAFYDLVVGLLDKGVPLDGVGFQFHVVDESPLDMISVYSNIKRFQDLGLEVDFTEIDVRIRQPIQDSKLASQADAYQDLMELVIGLDGVDNFTTWGLTDKYSWVPGFFEGYDASLPFDLDYQRKPAYDYVLAALEDDDFTLDYEERINNLSQVRSVLRPYDIALLESQPVLDGQKSESEYAGTVINSFMYNQLGSDATYDSSDISGSWRIGYFGNVLYGYVERQDDVTIANHGTNYENDTVEVFYEYGTTFKQLRTIIGQDFEYSGGDLLKKAVWNEEGTVLEFAIEMSEKDLTGLTMGFNIALSDNDDRNGAREVQLYPYYGKNLSWSGKDLANMVFEGDTPRPAEKLRLTPPVEVKARLAANDLNGEETGYEWMNSGLLPLGYNQLEALDQQKPVAEDLTISYRLTHFEDKLYGILYRNDDQVEMEDAVTFAIEMEDEWHVWDVAVGDNQEGSEFTIQWYDETSAEFMIHLEGTSLIYNYSISTQDWDNGELKYDLYPSYNYDRSYEEGNYIELILN